MTLLANWFFGPPYHIFWILLLLAALGVVAYLLFFRDRGEPQIRQAEPGPSSPLEKSHEPTQAHPPAGATVGMPYSPDTATQDQVAKEEKKRAKKGRTGGKDATL